MRALQLAQSRTLRWIDLPEPAAPGPGEALVAIRTIGICGTDLSGYLGKMPFIEYPRILGHELGVEVLAVGPDVHTLKIGDRCSVEPYLNCGHCHACRQGRTNCCETLTVLGVHCDGGMRERMVLPAHKLHVSETLDFEQLALVETLAIGCHAVNRAAILPEDDVLIIGAGPIGLTVLEFARLVSSRLTVLELSASRRAFVRQHYPGITVVETLPDEPAAQVVFDATGNATSMARALSLARFTGRIVYVGITKDPIPLDDPLLHRRELTLLASRNAHASDFPRILSLIQQGHIHTQSWLTHRADWNDLPALMETLTTPGTESVKAIARIPCS
ncbi:zinc-binding alcohol dehydrogenase family protein [Prosthecobacter dejongeii]|uniref:Alcohol dehydrogenase n=1 Tax=Prosthecobacter dejongeii TaxID=48465 RepID=A0A7W8DR13_9BACT|nr:zinc-binding alcohol dehydrogenase family protein [Prosthecobacter dejongeii]MBB5039048.1 alcohol dehydrogenase [Prosthecobacter dejongeii]